MSQLKVRGLTKDYETPAETIHVLRDIQLEMQSGEHISIVGPSGCGKSTLLHILGTLARPTTGTVELDGENPFSFKPKKLARYRNEKIGFIFQDHQLLPQLSLIENVLLPVLARERVKTKHVDRARGLIEEMGLTHRTNHHPAELSGGERQRVAVARALMNQPVLVLADEPTGNLDIDNTLRIADVLYSLPATHNTMLIVVTHSDLLARKAMRSLHVDHGVLLESPSPSAS